MTRRGYVKIVFTPKWCDFPQKYIHPTIPLYKLQMKITVAQL